MQQGNGAKSMITYSNCNRMGKEPLTLHTIHFSYANERLMLPPPPHP